MMILQQSDLEQLMYKKCLKTNWLFKFFQSKPMALPAPSGKYIDYRNEFFGNKSIDQKMTQETANNVLDKFPNMFWIGHGNNGIAYECRPNVICKITQSEFEAERAITFQRKPNKYFIKVYQVIKIQNNPSLWLLEVEKVTPLNNKEMQAFPILLENVDYITRDTVPKMVPFLSPENAIKFYDGIKLLDYVRNNEQYIDLHENNVGWNSSDELVILDIG